MAGTVVIAIDNTEAAEKAFEWYMDHLHRAGNRICILHCVDLSSVQGVDAEVTSEASFTQLWHQQRKKIKALEEKYQWKLNEAGLTGKIRTEEGKPGEVVCRVCKEEKAGLIVIGSRGLRGIKRTLKGSVSDHVLHNCSCPVVVCRQYEPPPPPEVDNLGEGTSGEGIRSDLPGSPGPGTPLKKGSPFRRLSLKRRNSNKSLGKTTTPQLSKECP